MLPKRSLRQRDTVRLFVVHHPASRQAATVADAVVRYFEGDSVTLIPHPISTRVLSQAAIPDDLDGPPPLIDFTASAFSIAILLADGYLQRALANGWGNLRRALVDAILPRPGPATTSFCLPLVIAMDQDALDPLQTEEVIPEDGAIQAERAYDWPHSVSADHGIVRILLHACRLMLDGLKQLQPDEGDLATQRSVFLSHAKADLPCERAESLVHGLAARMQGTNYGFEAYLDETHALPGRPWRHQFRQAIDRGALIAFDGEAYPSRPECQRELLRAKRSRRPILTINAPPERPTIRFAYSGNLPVVPLPPVDDFAMDQLMLNLFSEMLRVELWSHEARAVTQHAGLEAVTLLPRTVELADLAFHVLDRCESDSPGGATLVYPDPPLPPHLRELIDALRPPTLSVRPLSDLA